MSSGFISEGDLAEKERIQKENWKKTRTENDPEERPDEPPFDPRTLFEQLKEHKDKKQEEWDEAHKLKNMVRGLEDDEVDYLEFVDNTKLQEEKRIKQEETLALKEYRKKVSEMQQKASESDMLADLRPDTSNKKLSGSSQGKKSQLSLLAGAIKRKNTDRNEDTKKQKSSEATELNSTKNNESTKVVKSIECVAILPGLGVYTDSSDSENDSDIEIQAATPRGMIRDLTGRLVKLDGF